jgi:hypothetical protein
MPVALEGNPSPTTSPLAVRLPLTVTSPWMVSPPGASSAAVPCGQRDSQHGAPDHSRSTPHRRKQNRQDQADRTAPEKHRNRAPATRSRCPDPLGRKHKALLAHRRRRPDPQAPGPPRHPRQRPDDHAPLSTVQVAPPGSTAATTPRRRTSPVRCSGSEVVAMARPWRGIAQLTRGVLGWLAGQVLAAERGATESGTLRHSGRPCRTAASAPCRHSEAAIGQGNRWTPCA